MPDKRTQVNVGVSSVVIKPVVGDVSVTWLGAAAQACCGEIVNPINNVDEITEPIKMSDNRKEATKFFREDPVLVGVLILFRSPRNVYLFRIK